MNSGKSSGDSLPTAGEGSAGLSGVQGALRGALGFGATSIVVYGTVAFGGRWLYRHLTEAGAYSFWAALYLLGTPYLLGRLLAPWTLRRRYAAVFILAFLAYAMGWVAMYFTWRHKFGEILGSILGPTLFAVVMATAFRKPSTIPGTAAVVSIGHAVGYFAGDFLNTTVGGPTGMLLWGVCHGAGFGAVLGWASTRWIPLAPGTADVPGSGGS